jgi:hypothetical protein
MKGKSKNIESRYQQSPVILKVVLFFLILIVGCSIPSLADQLTEGLKYQQARQEQLLASLTQKEKKAERALMKSRNAYANALRVNDQKALPIAEKAVSVAGKALNKLRSQKQRVESRVRAINRTLHRADENKAAVASVIQGKIFKKTPDGWVRLESEPSFQVGDELKTGSNGFMEIIAGDGNFVHVGPSSQILFERFDEKESIYQQFKGKVHLIITCVKESINRRNINLKTKIANVAVRGTEFATEYTYSGSFKIYVLRGKVEIASEGNKASIILKEGHWLEITQDDEYPKPLPLDKSNLNVWWD